MSLVTENTPSPLDLSNLSLYYRPFFNSQTGSIVSLDSIVWLNCDSTISAEINRLRMLCEETQIIRIGNWNIKTACEQNARFRDGMLSVFPVMVRILPEQLHDESLIPIVLSSLKKAHLPAKFIEMAIPEALVFQNYRSVLEAMRKFDSVEIPITIYDFGIDYSIFRLIRNLPVKSVKYHKSLVSQIGRSKKAEHYLSLLSKRLIDSGVSCCGTHVTSDSQKLFLLSIGCDIVQYAKPPISFSSTAKLLLPAH